MNPLKLLLRAFNGNLSRVSLTETEQAALEARGIREPVVQRYLIWRNAMMLMVVIATVFSVVWTTCTDLADTGEEPSVLQSLSDEILEGVANAAPESETGTAAGNAADPASDQEDEDEPEPEMNTFEKFTDIVQTAALYALAGAALLAFVFRHRPKLSFRLLVAGFLFGFFVPIAIALCPWSWFGYVEEDISPLKDPNGFLANAAEGAVEAMTMLAGLLPAVLALIPGVLKGCLRVKTLLPASTLPGWFVVMAAPLYGLFLLAVFVALNQITSDTLLIGGVVLLVVAHMVYPVRASTFTRPIIDAADYARMKNSQRIVLLLTLGAAALVVTYLITRKFMGAHILGTNPDKSFMTPFDLVGFGFEFISRTMFVGVLSVDLFVRVNRAAWNDSKRIGKADSSGGYQNTMEALDAVLK